MGFKETYIMHTAHITIHLGICVIVLQAGDVQAMYMHCYS